MAIPPTVPIIGLTWDDVLFVIFATIMIGSALLVVSMRDIIRCGLAMMVSFAGLAGLYVLLGSALMAAAQVLVYIGAISVLILFAIMLTQSKAAPARLVFQTQAVAAAVAAIVLVVIMAITITATDWGEVGQRLRTATDQLATVLFNAYVLPFEIVSVLLLAAVIGGVFLARREHGAADPGGRGGGPGSAPVGGRPVQGSVTTASTPAAAAVTSASARASAASGGGAASAAGAARPGAQP